MMTWLVAYGTKFSIQYDALAYVVFYICLGSLIPFPGSVTIYANI